MRREYDLAKLTWRRNPYARRLKRIVTIRLDDDVVRYFKALGGHVGIPYQRLINLYLRECLHARRRPTLHWKTVS